MRTPLFEIHIRPMFRLTDRAHMSFAFDIHDYDDVAEHADAIIERLEDGDMPPPGAAGPWPPEWISLFKRWVETGKKRLEIGTAEWGITPAAAVVTVTATGTFPAKGYAGWIELESETETTKTYALYLESPETAAAGEPDAFALKERYRANDTRTVFARQSTGVTQLS